MQILSGFAHGLKLNWTSCDKIRPTTERVKEALFNIIQFDIENKNFLDLFGGSGQIGIEAASRGANEVYIVEKNFDSIKIIHKNLKKLKFQHKIKTIKLDSIKFLNNVKYENYFDIIFLDPPFESNLIYLSLTKIEKVLKKNGLVIAEIPTKKRSEIENFLKNNSNLYLKKFYKYGSINLILLLNSKEGSNFEH